MRGPEAAAETMAEIVIASVLGHPSGASGARIPVGPLDEMGRRDARKRLAVPFQPPRALDIR